MNVFLIIVSMLLCMICVLLALLQHYYFIYKLYKKPPVENDVPVFEDLIPSDKYIHAFSYPVQTVEGNDDIVLNDLNSVLSQPKKTEEMKIIRKADKVTGTDTEAYNTLQAAIAFKLSGKNHKAIKLFEHAAAIAPDNADVLNWYGEFLEQQHQDVVTADELYFKVSKNCTAIIGRGYKEIF